MAILDYIEKTETKKHPVKFQCDICKSVFEIQKEFDLEYRSNLKDQMAVIKYWFPTQYSYGTDEYHCCSTECLAKAIKEISCGAEITIPSDGFYKK